MTAYAYLRKSVVSQDRPGDTSREVQEAAVTALAARHGDEPVMLVDWGLSGRTDKRPGYRRLWDAIESGEATAIYSYSLSRLSRSLADLNRLVRVCADLRIPVRLVADSMDTSSASGRLLANVLASVAEFEADVAGERVRAMYDGRRARGEKVSNTPTYGDRAGEDLHAVMAAFAEAGSFMGAARILNERGVPTRLGRPWIAASVSVIVRRHRAYVPHAGRGRRTIGSFRLARLLRCHCGTFLTGSTDRRSGIIRYQCRLGSMVPHQQVSITERRVMPVIREEMSRLRTPDRIAALADQDAQRSSLTAERDRVADMYQSGLIDRVAMVDRIAGIDARVTTLDTRTIAMDVPAIDWDGTPASLNRVLRALLTRIDLGPDLMPKSDGFDWTVPEWRAS